MVVMDVILVRVHTPVVVVIAVRVIIVTVIMVAVSEITAIVWRIEATVIADADGRTVESIDPAGIRSLVSTVIIVSLVTILVIGITARGIVIITPVHLVVHRCINGIILIIYIVIAILGTTARSQCKNNGDQPKKIPFPHHHKV